MRKRAYYGFRRTVKLYECNVRKVVWTNGNKIDFYRKDLQTGSIGSWLGIPKYQQSWDSIETRKDDLLFRGLKATFRRCHNAIYRSGIDSGGYSIRYGSYHPF